MVEGVPQIDALDGFEWALYCFECFFGADSGDEIVAVENERFDLGGGFLELFVFEKLLHQLPPGIDLVFFYILIGALVFLR